MNAFQSFEQAKATMAKDVAALKFEGSTVLGGHGLINIDLLSGKLKARTAPDAKPCCYINLPTAAGKKRLDVAWRKSCRPSQTAAVAPFF